MPKTLDNAKLQNVNENFPFFPHKVSELLPSQFDSNKMQGFIFKENKTKAEFVGFDPNATRPRSTFGGRQPAPTEVVLCANTTIPLTSLNDYYFEITIDQMESNGSFVSIGFIPEGNRQWANGSYRYQANAKKTSFVNGSRKQQDYGTAFRAKNVVGCGYNKEEKSIFFTRDGIDQGVAFPNIVLSGKILPSIGVSKGVVVSINFGQKPFAFKSVVEGETEQEREKRKKKEEETRIKLQKLEAEKKLKQKKR